MPQFLFGTGNLFIQPAGGGSPLNFGSLLDVSVDMSADVKEMNGQYTLAQAVARGKSKIQCKATSGQIDVGLFNQIFFGGTVASGSVQASSLEAHLVPSSPAYTVTVGNGASFLQDQGVVYAATGNPLTQVASGPAAGQYSVNSASGVYNFSSADAAAFILVSYTFTSISGHSVAISNRVMGLAPTFQCVLSDSYNFNGSLQTVTLMLYSCVASKLSMPLKAEDFLQTDLEWECQTNASGQVGQFSEASLAIGAGGSLDFSQPGNSGFLGTI